MTYTCYVVASVFLCSRYGLLGNRRSEPLLWSYDHGSSDTPLLGYTIGQMLEQTSNKQADKLAYIFSEDRLTFSELLEQVNIICLYYSTSACSTTRYLCRQSSCHDRM